MKTAREVAAEVVHHYTIRTVSDGDWMKERVAAAIEDVRRDARDEALAEAESALKSYLNNETTDNDQRIGVYGCLDVIAALRTPRGGQGKEKG